MDNNPLAYVRESKLVVLQIRWLSKLVLFDFYIKYRKAKSNKAADTLSPGEMDSGSDSEEYETMSYTTVCKKLEDIIDGEKLPIECKVAIQEKQNKPAQQDLELHSSVTEVLSKVTPLEMKDAQQTDPHYQSGSAVCEGKK